MRRDLALVVALACLALVVGLLPVPVWLHSALLIPLVLVLPGYALAALLFPPGGVSLAERGVYSVGLSIAVTAVGGLVVQLAIGLDRASWAVFLASVTIAAGVVGLRTQAARTEPPKLARPRGLLLGVAVFLPAALIAALSIVLARDGLREAQGKINFTDFWMLPVGSEHGREILTVGLRNHGTSTARYLIELERDGRRIASARPRLHGAKHWEREFVVETSSGGAPIVASLIRNGKTYRRLDLENSQ